MTPNYNQQDEAFLDLFISTDALHVSGGSSAHHQEHTTVHRASGIVNRYCCLLLSWMRWNSRCKLLIVVWNYSSYGARTYECQTDSPFFDSMVLEVLEESDAFVFMVVQIFLFLVLFYDAFSCQFYTGCFTTLGHNCRRWFPRSLWTKKFIQTCVRFWTVTELWPFETQNRR